MSLRHPILALVPLAALLAAPPALAESAPASDYRWYGFELLAADALSLTAMYAGAASGTDALAVPGVVGLFVAAPLVHAVEGNGGRALGSLGVRLVLPIAGAALASWDYDRNDKGDGCDCMGGALATFGGFALGLVSAMAVDALVLGWEREAPPPRKQLSLVPTVAVTPGGGGVGLAGRF
jgi:hypothetical protein